MITEKSVDHIIISLKNEIRTLKQRVITLEKNPVAIDDTVKLNARAKRIDINGSDYYIDENGNAYLNSLNLSAGITDAINRITSNTTIDDTYHNVICDTDGGAITVTLPAGTAGLKFVICNAGSSGNNVTVDADGTEEINGELTQTVSDGESISIVFESTEEWRVI